MDTLTTWTVNLTGAEVELIADALERLASRTGRWPEIAAFAIAHPEFGLLADEDEPLAEELR